ncbi:MAG: hypothetical protein PW786_07280 [Arachidicoccus sp.]|nr:hypothetical protein [Arachidicoccus sp.]
MLFIQNIYGQNINWESFLSRNDMTFDTLTTKWQEGVFTGNGLIGSMIFMENKNALRIELGRTDVTDHRISGNPSALYAKARLPIGYFSLNPVGKIIKNSARLHLWNAEATGVIETDKGKIFWKSFVTEKENVIIFQTKTEGEEKNFTWKWNAEQSVSPRMKFTPIDNFPSNPEHETGNEESIDFSKQKMLAGGDYVVAWKTVGKNDTNTTFISVGYDTVHSSLKQVLKTVKFAAAQEFANITNAHRQWWHQYYQKSFLSIPDAKAESFYWIQLYKIASATRSGTLPIDLMGPWFAPTPWPAYWYNLNIQLTYSPMCAANHLEMVEPLLRNIDKNIQNLINNVPPQYRYNAAAIARSGALNMVSPLKVTSESDTSSAPGALELGDLTWILYYYWQYYSYSKNDSVLKNFIPLLKRSINYYIDVMHKEADGKWHLPYTYSPEYPDGKTRDCNYALSLFRWGCETLLTIDPNDKLTKTWKDVLENLTPYPTDSTGLRIGKDVAFAKSHRHYSHLLMIYPLHLLNWDNEGDRDLIRKSLYHWHSLKGAFQGYSFTGGASIYSLMGKGDSALNYLDELFSHFVKPNTMYMESGPVIETPLAAAASLQELLLQSWNGKVRVFPAVPATWQDVSFEDMRADGAFLISAVRKEGKTRWIKIKSLEGGKCTFVTDLKGTLKTKSDNQANLIKVGVNTYQINLVKGQSVIIYANADDVNIAAAPVSLNNQTLNYWGTKNKK